MSIYDLRNYLTILGNLSDYEPIFNQAKQLIEVQKVLLSIVPPSVKNRCAVGRYADGVVLVYADNGVIASRLRQLTPTILRHLTKHNFTIHEIKIAVRPNPTQNHRFESPKRTHQLNPSATRHLRDLITTLPDKSPLGQALTKFLNHKK